MLVGLAGLHGLSFAYQLYGAGAEQSVIERPAIERPPVSGRPDAKRRVCGTVFEPSSPS